MLSKYKIMIAEGVGEGEVRGGSVLYLMIQRQVRAIAVKLQHKPGSTAKIYTKSSPQAYRL